MTSRYLFIAIFFASMQYQEKCSLDFENTDLEVVIDCIAKQTGKNIVCGKDVSGTVTIKMYDTS